MKRIGKFFIAAEAIESVFIHEVFKRLEFVPYRVEFLYHRKSFECIGVSPMFELNDDFMEAPEYTLRISTEVDKGETVLSEVKAIKDVKI